MFEKILESIQSRFENGEMYLNDRAKESKWVKYLVLPIFQQLWFYTYIIFSPFGLMVVAMLLIGSVHLWLE
ncbi:MAG: hypothetical protein CMF25_02345 [Kangiellaceae bacterium]|jgi:hypothetical protein|nr:hypothetical protein [Kangiellaceae bacterium]|tara:strand:- start:3135 stop:3347 length:213 start_codon:yes stop_codon:yes gene_type:complete